MGAAPVLAFTTEQVPAVAMFLSKLGRPGRTKASALATAWFKRQRIRRQQVRFPVGRSLRSGLLLGMDGDMAEQELSLIQFATREVAVVRPCVPTIFAQPRPSVGRVIATARR